MVTLRTPNYTSHSVNQSTTLTSIFFESMCEPRVLQALNVLELNFDFKAVFELDHFIDKWSNELRLNLEALTK